MSSIKLIGITKRWDDTIGVDNVSFTVEEGCFVVLLGPSGCGKSTTLRIIAGLETATAGSIYVGEKDVTNLPPGKRSLSMVFQSYALFPHLNVAENIVFGLKVRKTPNAEREERLQKVAKIVGLDGLLDRRAAQLSGGQRQRVALARAIIAENNICLMDEPLSNLDSKLRHEMRTEIRDLQQRLGMTVVYVTHDQTEAMSMADKVILLNGGHIEHEGAPQDLYDRPANLFTASFIGTPPMNLLDLQQGPNGFMIRKASGSKAEAVALNGAAIPAHATNSGLKLGIRPEHIELFAQSTEPNALPVSLISADYQGADTVLNATIAGQPLLIRVPGRVELRSLTQAAVNWKPAAAHFFDAGTGRRVGS